MKVNRYADIIEKSFLNGADFSDAPVSTENEVIVQSESEVGPRAYNLPAYPTPPPSLDYRTLGYVTPVEDQGFCASCYAFAAVCGIEGQVAKQYGKLNSISSQNIVDCSGKYGNGGCLGGNMAMSYKYIISNPGIANKTAYPYTGNNDTCAYNSSILEQKVLSYSYVTGDENYLKSVLAAVGPLPVGVRGSLDSLFYYASGIYDDPSCVGPVDHAVCLVGYGTDNSTNPPKDYWIAKNSWSSDWGEGGYFRLKMGSNLCGIRNYVVYPTIL
ncbi:cathepsin L-like peptidase [Chironomus tepperi]|uniref:cathepsin L-like peptidase n=1 Tax=Chironomus tepperi TaxID=113505 RepID=UPI00391FA304